jgi:membrane peptidoglycan carboxypeptidase
MEVALYRAVDYNVNQMRLDGGPLPWYALIGAELQNPANGSIIAMYAGRGQNMSSAQCAKYDCQDNTAVYAREQVGSSFKPYVLATAVNEGMNVKSSILNGYSPLWVPPDTTTADQLALSARSQAQALPQSYPITNDGNASYGAMNVQNAFAQSSNTAFSDLAHRAGTQSVINMAENMGVSSLSYKEGGPGLQQYHDEVGLALGIAPLTVNEQDTMLSTIDNNGTYHSAHVVKSVTSPTGGTTPGIVTEREVLTPALDSQVQYAMSMVTVNGTGTAAAMSDGRPIIAKTGTTDNAQSAFFIGAIPQYALTVGIFTQNQSTHTTQSLNGLGGNVGGGFGGYWPARIWNTFAEAEFAKLPIEQFQQAVFTGAKWNQVGNIPKKKKKQPKHGGTPTPTPGHGHHGHHPFPTPTPTFTFGQPTTTPTATANPTGTATATPTTTATATGKPGKGGGAAAAAAKVNGAQAGVALGGVFSVLPGSLLWARASRRRRRRRSGVVG